MSTIKANAILDASGGNTVTINSVTPTAYNTMGKNLIINGAMEIAQRGTSFTSLTNAYTLDRMRVYRNGNHDFTVTQESDAPSGSGFQKSIKIQTTTADATLDSADYSIFQYNIEGKDLQQLAYGSSGAKSKTLSFWVKSNMTGNLSVTSEVNTGPPFLSGYVTINAADTWEYKTITYVGNTSTTIDNDNTTGIELQFWLSAGSGISGGTYNNTSWNSDANSRVNPTNQINIQNSTSNYIQFTGLQLEAGSVATEFERRPYGMELALCQRYYEKSYDYATAPGTATFLGAEWFYNLSSANMTQTGGKVTYKVPKRITTATFTPYSPNTGTSGKFYTNSSGDVSPNYGNAGGETGIACYGAFTATINGQTWLHWTSSAEL